MHQTSTQCRKPQTSVSTNTWSSIGNFRYFNIITYFTANRSGHRFNISPAQHINENQANNATSCTAMLTCTSWKIYTTRSCNFSLITNQELTTVNNCDIKYLQYFTKIKIDKHQRNKYYVKRDMQWFLGNRSQNGSPYAIGPLSVCL